MFSFQLFHFLDTNNGTFFMNEEKKVDIEIEENYDKFTGIDY